MSVVLDTKPVVLGARKEKIGIGGSFHVPMSMSEDRKENLKIKHSTRLKFLLMMT